MRFPSPAEAPSVLIRPGNLQGFIRVGGSRCQPTGLPHRGPFHPAFHSGLTLEKPLGPQVYITRVLRRPKHFTRNMEHLQIRLMNIFILICSLTVF